MIIINNIKLRLLLFKSCKNLFFLNFNIYKLKKMTFCVDNILQLIL